MNGIEEALQLRITSLEIVLALGMFAAYALFARRTVREHFERRLELRIEEVHDRRTLRLAPPITIGRGDDAQLWVQDQHVSRLHALVDVEDGAIFVEDLGSRNGTRVNASPIEGRVHLAPGDEIRVGRARIVYCGEVSWT